MPKLSIITINYNNAGGLEKTIRSVISQTVQDLEFIVIDGGSSDASVSLIKQFADRITCSVSEKDKGIYDAQNKGIAKATGDYLLFLNSGDSFYDETVVEKFKAFSNLHSQKVIYGNSNVVDADGSSKVFSPPAKLDLNFWYANTLNHQALFIHLDLYRKYGNFNTDYRFAADFDHLLRLFLSVPLEFLHFDQVVCNYDNTGFTSKDEYHKIILQERKESIRSHVSKENFWKMRSAYLATRSFESKLTIIITENAFLRTLLKPVYLLYKRIAK